MDVIGHFCMDFKSVYVFQKFNVPNGNSASDTIETKKWKLKLFKYTLTLHTLQFAAIIN